MAELSNFPVRSYGSPGLSNASASLQFEGFTMHMDFPDGLTQEQILAQASDKRLQVQNKIDFSNMIDSEDMGHRIPTNDTSLEFGSSPISPMSGTTIRAVSRTGTAEDPTRGVNINNAAAAGVDIQTGLTNRLRAVEDLLQYDDEVANAALEFGVRELFHEAGIAVPDDVDLIYQEPYSDERAYLRPTQLDNGEWVIKPTLMNSPGFDTGDAIGATAIAGQLGIELGGIAGGIAAAATPGGQAALGTALSAGGAFLTPWIYKNIAEGLGIPEEITAGIGTREQLIQAAWVLGPDMVLGAGMAIRSFGRSRRGAFFDSPEAAQEAIDIAQKQLARVRMLEERYPGVSFDFELGQLTRDPGLLGYLAHLRARTSGPEGLAITGRDIANRMAMVDAFYRVQGRHTPAGGEILRGLDNASTTGRISEDNVRRETRSSMREDLEVAVRELDNLRAGYGDVLDETGSLFNREFFELMQKDMAEAHTVYEAAYRETWQLHEDLIGVPRLGPEGTYNRTRAERGSSSRSSSERVPGTYGPNYAGGSAIRIANPPNSPINQFAARMARQSKESLSRSIQSAHAKLLNDLGLANSEAGQFLSGETLDMRRMEELTSELKRTERAMRAGDTSSGWQLHDLQEAIGIVDRTIEQGDLIRKVGFDNVTVQGDELSRIRASWLFAKDATEVYETLFDGTALKTMMQLDRSRTGFELGTQAVRASLLDNPRVLSMALDSIGNSTTHRKALLSEMDTYFRESVLDANNVVQQKALNDFLNSHEDTLNILTGGGRTSDNMDSIVKFSDMIEAAQVKITREENLLKSFGLKLEADEMGVLATPIGAQVLRLADTKILELKTALLRGGHDEAWENIQNRASIAVYADIAKAGDIPQLQRATAELVNRGNRLEVLFGPQYVDDLTIFRDVMNIDDLKRFATAARQESQPDLVQLTRSLFGPLSKKQRFLTAMLRIQRKRGTKALMELLANPTKLHQFVEVSAIGDDMLYLMGLARIGHIGILNSDEAERLQQFRARTPMGNTNMEGFRNFGRDNSAQQTIDQLQPFGTSVDIP